MKQALEMLLQIVTLKYSWKILLKIVPSVLTLREAPKSDSYKKKVHNLNNTCTNLLQLAHAAKVD
jgi:hypothetical protein